MTKLGTLAVIILSAIGFVACGAQTSKPVEGALGGVLEGAPKWVSKGCGVHFDDDKGVICGVGSVSGTRNIALARSAAQGRGRTEIARTLQLKIKAMLKDYQATVTGGNAFGVEADDEQVIKDASKQITDMSLPGSKMIDTWITEDGSTLFALMALDIEAFESSLSKMQGLNAKVREAIEARADKAFLELDAEIDKEREQ